MAEQALEIPTIDISGGPRERGLQYGRQAGEQIDASIRFYKEAFKDSSGLEWDQIVKLAEHWVDRATEYAPDLVEELRAVAEGADRDFLELMAINARGEIVYDKKFSDLVGGECTTYAVMPESSGDGHVYAGQNWDYLCGAMDSIIMLRIRGEGDPDIIMQIEAGQVGRHGANSAGIALQVNGLGGRYGFKGFGVPQPFVRRRVLQASNISEALRRVFHAPQQVGANYLLATREGTAISLETTPGERTGWLYPDGDGILVHGNHHEAHIPTGQDGPYIPMSMSSLYRVPIVRRELKRVLNTADGEQTRRAIAAALGNADFAPNSVCAMPDATLPATKQWQTVAATIVDLTTGEYLLSDGLPNERTFKTLPWNLYESADRVPA